MHPARPDRTPPRFASTRPRITLAILVLLAMTATGCYERVVEARGLGTAGMQTHKPQPSFFDRMFGPAPQPIDNTPRIRVN